MSELQRLFVYGSLQPGGPNEHVLAGIGGSWERAVIKGRLVQQGWGAGMGFPGLVVDDHAEEIMGHVFQSSDLRRHWKFLDDFEGEEYERIVWSVGLLNGEQLQAHVYVLRTSASMG